MQERNKEVIGSTQEVSIRLRRRKNGEKGGRSSPRQERERLAEPTEVMAQTWVTRSDPEVSPGAASPERLLRKLEGTARVEDADRRAGSAVWPRKEPARHLGGILSSDPQLGHCCRPGHGQGRDKGTPRCAPPSRAQALPGDTCPSRPKQTLQGG